ncbi:restriction endonuclease subunit S [Psychrobacter celer]|uniref:restriction endonuclease subunit S n=1 Tax=Psychrobacter celer TaxID=306572 RepID=UPI003FD02999
MSELRRYPDYKDSGVPWLGEIPSHWEVIDNKYLFNFSRGLTITKANLVDEGIPCINYGEVHSKYGFEVDPKIHKLKCVPKEYVEKFDYALLNRGDFIFADTSEDYKGSGNFTYLNSDEMTFAGYHTVVARLKTDDDPRFMAYLFDSNEFRTQVKTRVSGVKVFSITHNILKNVSVWIPSKSEQQAIVNFLDDKLNHIDTLISKQQQLIEKLAEQRSAVITHAVTKGLDPDAPMKDSGVEWLGDIPEHWDSFKITHLVETIGSGTTPKSSNSNYYADEGTLWVTTSELRESVIADTKKKLTEDALQDYSTLKVFPINSVAIAMYGATIGRLGILGEEATFNQACCVYSESEKIHYKFLYYWLWYRRPILISLSNGGGQPNLNQDDLRKLVIPIPAIKEQEEIVNYLDNKTQKIDKMSEATTDIITKLQEYRAALITQAVTGKIDVRYLNQQAS